MDQHDTSVPSDPQQGPRIVSTAGICGGRPRIRGTRVRVVDVLDMLASGMSEAEILRDYPYIAREDVEACLHYVRRFADLPVLGLAS
ncbi:MAG TPA: DUF433 domain-containing protein [Phycisphaerales bacterium]|nr:DUF433 domain-containing protein [Phycisphaerales bacterium]